MTTRIAKKSIPFSELPDGAMFHRLGATGRPSEVVFQRVSRTKYIGGGAIPLTLGKTFSVDEHVYPVVDAMGRVNVLPVGLIQTH